MMNFETLSKATLDNLDKLETNEDRVAFLKAAYAQCYSMAQEDNAPQLEMREIAESGVIH